MTYVCVSADTKKMIAMLVALLIRKLRYLDQLSIVL